MKKESPFTIDQAADYMKKDLPEFIRLIDPIKDETLSGYNTKISESGKKLDAIIKMLKGNKTPDGLYSIQYRFNLDQVPVDVFVKKGKGKLMSESIVPVVVKEDNVRSMSEALKDQIRVKELEMENQRLKDQLAEAYLDDADDLADEVAPEPMANTIISLLKEIGLPLLEKHFEMQERKLQMMAAKAPAQQTQVAVPKTYAKPVINPAIVPQQNQPQPQQIIYQSPAPGSPGSGGTAPEFKPADNTELAELIDYIQSTDAAELNTWLKQLKMDQGEEIVSAIIPIVDKYRKADLYTIIEGL